MAFFYFLSNASGYYNAQIKVNSNGKVSMDETAPHDKRSLSIRNSSTAGYFNGNVEVDGILTVDGNQWII